MTDGLCGWCFARFGEACLAGGVRPAQRAGARPEVGMLSEQERGGDGSTSGAG